MDKYRPETKEAKTLRLKQRAVDKAEGKVWKILIVYLISIEFLMGLVKNSAGFI